MKKMKKSFYAHLRKIVAICAFQAILFTTFCQGFSPATKTKLQAVLAGFQNNPNHPFTGGISAAIKVDGLALWQGATGYAARNIDEQNNIMEGGTPFTIDSLSRIYSITKTFTAALVLELANEGAFSLSESISTYLPIINAVNPGINTSVTIHQLLAHESGYSDYSSELALQIAVAFNPAHIWTPYEMVSFVHQENPPGTKRQYSSTNYVLLGAMIEAATGKTIEQHFRERFLKPLDLASMYLGERELIGNRGMLASPHDNISAFNPIFQFTGQPTFPNAYTNISRFPMNAIASLAFTGGGLVSNVADVAEWGNVLFGGRATSKSTIDAMLNSISPQPDEDGDHLGYGIFSNTKISTTDYFVGHNGKAVGYKSAMFYQPDRKMTLVVLSNFAGANEYEIAKKLYDVLPAFLCGNENKKEAKIVICRNGNEICVDRAAAANFIQKGAYLGGCDAALKLANHPLEHAGKLLDENDKLTAFPNPLVNATTLSFCTSKSGLASLQLFDMNGKMLSSLFEQHVEGNKTYRVKIAAGKLQPGIYICSLQSATGITQQKLVVKY
jgi:D-alanyl-D-alanine carboxypeptidase